jgi:hypothetical protein
MKTFKQFLAEKNGHGGKRSKPINPVKAIAPASAVNPLVPTPVTPKGKLSTHHKLKDKPGIILLPSNKI